MEKMRAVPPLQRETERIKENTLLTPHPFKKGGRKKEDLKNGELFPHAMPAKDTPGKSKNNSKPALSPLRKITRDRLSVFRRAIFKLRLFKQG